MSIDAERRLAGALFVALLLLSVFWPSPIVAINALWLHRPLSIDELSFLGREAPSWDVVYWCIVGLFALYLLRPVEGRLAFRDAWLQLRATRVRVGLGMVAGAVTSAIAIALVWRFADGPVTAFAEALESDRTESIVRILNRFGGGMNPPMIIGFFLFAGLAYARRSWIAHAVAMTLAGASAGVIVQVVKYTAGRTRPELWLGRFQHARASATSFPSGHTVGAFALAGVLMFGSRSRGLRATAFVLALAVGISRVMAFRHWTSDVLASAIIGLWTARLFVTPVTGENEPAS